MIDKTDLRLKPNTQIKRKVIVTGANGAGKSHFAARLAVARADQPLISYDALRLKTDWIKRPHSEIEAALSNSLKGDTWIIEGGPSLLSYDLAAAEGIVWPDTPKNLRAW